MEFKDLIEKTAKTFEEMKDYGFPENVTTAFLTTADKVNSMVMSRVPGKATTTLIDEGYDLKSMYIKAKSCDWGPMAGFVCELHPFNKKGTGGIEFNEKKIKEYKSKLTNGEIAEPTVNKETPFTHIKILGARVNEIFENNGSAKDLNIENIEKGNEEIKGYACDKKENPTVLMQFMMKKEGDLWALYHGEIYTNKSGNGFNKYEQKGLDTCGISAVWSKNSFHSKDFSKTPKIYPIRGLMNPYLPYYDKENTENYYKNAVAGDYDLFAVWPSKDYSEKELERATEVLAEDFNLDSVNPFFARACNKKLSVYSATNKNVYIEIIPEEDEEKSLMEKQVSNNEKKLQDILKDRGNINNIIYLTAQQLNSMVQFIYQNVRSGDFPNRAFHSDEGGRPGVTEIDYPFAVFLPPVISVYVHKELCQSGSKDPSILIIENREQFVTLINMLKESCYVILNYGWMVNLFTSQEYDSIKDDLKKILLGDNYVDSNNTLEHIKTRLEEIASDQKTQDKASTGRKYKKSQEKIEYFMKPYEQSG